jgi:hypothetical protein
MFYYQTDFDFSPSAKQYIKNIYKHKFNQNYYHDLESEKLISPISPPGREIVKFLSKYNLNINYQGIMAFTSNSGVWFEGNPHVDIIRINGEQVPIRTRFNIMIEGNIDDTMYWWKDINWGSDQLIQNQFTLKSGITYNSYSIPGDSPMERWDYMGEPSDKKDKLLTPSAFVRTDCTHTVNVSPGPRLIITVAFAETFDDIVSRLNS